MLRTFDDAQGRLDIGIQQTGVQIPRALRAGCSVLGAVDEQHAGPLGSDEQLGEDSVLGGGQRRCEPGLGHRYVFTLRGEQLAERVADRGLVQARPVVEVGAVLEPQARELHARIRRHARRGGVRPEVRGWRLGDWRQGRACRVHELRELGGVEELVTQEEGLCFWQEEV